MSVSLRSALRDTLGLAVRRRSAARTWRVVQRAAHRPHVANLRDVHHDWHEDGGEAIIAMKTPAIENAVLGQLPRGACPRTSRRDGRATSLRGGGEVAPGYCVL